MSATGYIQVHTYTGFAQLPLEDAAITVTSADGTAIAMRITDRNGRITPIQIPVPDLAQSQYPDPGEKPFVTVNLYAHKHGYEQIVSENLQVFADITTEQDLMMIPLSELPQSWNQSVLYDTPPQNL